MQVNDTTQPIFGHVTIKDGVLTFVPADGSHPMTAKVAVEGHVMGISGGEPMPAADGPYTGHAMGISGGTPMTVEKPNE